MNGEIIVKKGTRGVVRQVAPADAFHMVFPEIRNPFSGLPIIRIMVSIWV